MFGQNACNIIHHNELHIFLFHFLKPLNFIYRIGNSNKHKGEHEKNYCQGDTGTYILINPCLLNWLLKFVFICKTVQPAKGPKHMCKGKCME